MPWFHTGSGRGGSWAADEFTELYKENIRAIRKRFGTSKLRTGVDGNGRWEPCTLRHNNVLVKLDEFNWGSITRYYGEWTPEFDLSFRIARMRENGWIARKIFRQPQFVYETFYRTTLRMYFPEYYPDRNPTIFNLMAAVRRLDASSDHHVLGNGKLCIFSGSHDWSPSRDNACSAFLVGLEWCVMHYENFGW